MNLIVTFAVEGDTKKGKNFTSWLNTKLPEEVVLDGFGTIREQSDENKVSEHYFVLDSSEDLPVDDFVFGLHNLLSSKKTFEDNPNLIIGSVNVGINTSLADIESKTKDELAKLFYTSELLRYKGQRDLLVMNQRHEARLSSLEESMSRHLINIDKSGALIAYTFLEELANKLESNNVIDKIDLPKLYH